MVLFLLAGIWNPVSLAAQDAVQHPVSPATDAPRRLDYWILEASQKPIPILSRKGKEARQFRKVVEALERYLDRKLETAEIAGKVVARHGSIQKRLGELPETAEGNWSLPEDLLRIVRTGISLNADQLVWTVPGGHRRFTLGKNPAATAERFIRETARAMGRDSKTAESYLWYLWMESCLDVLDSPFNHYVYADQMSAFDASRFGKSFGPGLVPEISGSRLVAKEVFDPVLQRAGLVPGSELTAVDGQALSGDSDHAFLKWLRPEKFVFRISFLADGTERTATAEALPFRHQTLSWTRVEEFVYVRLTSFSRDSLIELRRMFRSLKSSPPKGLILDLRGNPGGVANMGVTDCFFKPGQPIVTYRELPHGAIRSEDASLEYYDTPLVLLVDKRSASMSEVFAAAVSVHKRGWIIGEDTFGKAVGQRCQAVGPEGQLCLVHTRYYYPGTDISWDGKGIAPDIRVKVPEHEREALDAMTSTYLFDMDRQLKSDAALREGLRVLRGEDR